MCGDPEVASIQIPKYYTPWSTSTQVHEVPGAIRDLFALWHMRSNFFARKLNSQGNALRKEVLA